MIYSLCYLKQEEYIWFNFRYLGAISFYVYKIRVIHQAMKFDIQFVDNWSILKASKWYFKFSIFMDICMSGRSSSKMFRIFFEPSNKIGLISSWLTQYDICGQIIYLKEYISYLPNVNKSSSVHQIIRLINPVTHTKRTKSTLFSIR